jgi:hypothetical protein
MMCSSVIAMMRLFWPYQYVFGLVSFSFVEAFKEQKVDRDRLWNECLAASDSQLGNLGSFFAFQPECSVSYGGAV